MLKEFHGKSPQIHPSAYVDQSACLIGDVIVEKDAGIFPNATLRADAGKIIIKKGANVQDQCIMHMNIDGQVIIEERASVGHGAIIHQAVIGECSMVGMGAIILDRAEIGKHCLIAAGALVPEGKIIPDRSLVIGVPGRVVRELTEEEIQGLEKNARDYQYLSSYYRDQK